MSNGQTTKKKKIYQKYGYLHCVLYTYKRWMLANNYIKRTTWIRNIRNKLNDTLRTSSLSHDVRWMLNSREFSNCLSYKMRSIHFGCSIAIEFDSRWMTAKHRDTKGVNVIMFYSSFSFKFSLIFFFHFICNCALSAYCFVKNFLWINSHWSLIIIRSCSKFSEILDWNDLVFALSSSSYERECWCQIAKWIVAALHSQPGTTLTMQSRQQLQFIVLERIHSIYNI